MSHVNAKTLTLSQLSKAPIIDAKVTDWPSGGWNVMGQCRGTTTNMSAKMQVGFDCNALYVIVEVIDAHADTLSPNSYENDCVEIRLSLDTNSYSIRGKYVSGTMDVRKQRDKDFPRGISGGQGHGSSKDTLNIGGEVWSVKGFTDHGMVAEIDEGTKYTQEWMIPWQPLLDSVKLFGKPWVWDGGAIKFEVDVADNTGLPVGYKTGGRTQQCFWNSNADIQWATTQIYGTLLFNFGWADSNRTLYWPSCSYGVIDENKHSEKLIMFPNPVSENLNISNDGFLKEIYIRNILGEDVIRIVAQNENTITIPTDKLKSSIYLITLINKSGSISTLKFVKR
jgi:hypothetical protein